MKMLKMRPYTVIGRDRNGGSEAKAQSGRRSKRPDHPDQRRPIHLGRFPPSGRLRFSSEASVKLLWVIEISPRMLAQDWQRFQERPGRPHTPPIS